MKTTTPPAPPKPVVPPPKPVVPPPTPPAKPFYKLGEGSDG